MPKGAITGFYRFTDIWYDWAPQLPEKDGQYLKAILAHDSITHCDHPLHEDGVTGVKLYRGMLESGKSLLLFSSCQVDYIRYWLHSMGFTENIIPLPYSDCMLTQQDLKSVAPDIYIDGGSLRNAQRNIDKLNKKIKGSNPSLTARRLAFEQVRTLFQAKTGTWLAMDFEAYEWEHKTITEFGWSKLTWDAEGNEIQERGHAIIKEHRHLTNGRWVPEHRDEYGFGESDEISKKDFSNYVQDVFPQDLTKPLFIIFHDPTQDLRYLDSLAAPITNRNYNLPEKLPASGVFVVDTRDLFSALEGEESGGNRKGLEKVCMKLNVISWDESWAPFHNAGNDAEYTMSALKTMASGPTIDTQREERWPGMSKGITAVWDDDDDDDDEYNGPL